MKINSSLAPQRRSANHANEEAPPISKTGEGSDFIEFRKGEITESFEKLCEMLIKLVSSLKFKRDCFEA